MDKKLPGIYANKIEKELTTNEHVFYSNSKEGDEVSPSVKNDSNNRIDNALNINQKINSIFNSRKYVYKANVKITTKQGEYIKKIIGQNKTHLITIENELIPISDIINIEFDK